MHLYNTRVVKLNDGSEMTVSMTAEFERRVRQHFKIDNNNDISDSHIRMFLFGAVKNAIDKAEAEKTDELEVT